ncbi:MAG: hypothetical protein Kow0098_18580 [Ignavibacteriaceae bacterium]
MVKAFSVLFFIFCLKVSAQQIEVSAFTDTTDYLIGDYIYFTLSVTHDSDLTVVNIPLTDSLKSLELISPPDTSIKVEQNNITEEYKIIFSRYDSSSVSIPAIPVYYKAGSGVAPRLTEDQLSSDSTIRVIYTKPFVINIHSLKVSKEEDIKDVKDPIKIPLDWRMILLWILAGIGLVVFIIYLYKKFRKKKGTAEKTVRIEFPPHVQALNSLRELESKKLWQKGLVKEYHSEITGIIRTYFEKRFGFPALELTTSEVLELLSDYREAAQIYDLTKSFLNNADLVKFAKYIPLGSVNEEMMKQAYGIVERTIPEMNIAETVEENNA